MKPFTHPVLIPLLNSNEPEAVLTSLQVSEGQYVAAGEILCTLETTKSTAELEAETSGYVTGLRFLQGQKVQAGQVFCYISDSPVKKDSSRLVEKQAERAEQALPQGLRISKPALALARASQVNLGQLPIGPLVTKSMIQELIHQRPQENGQEVKIESPVEQAVVQPLSREFAFDPTAILVYGGGGHGKSLIDLLRMLGTYRIVGIIDDGLPRGEMVLGIPVLGGNEALPGLYIQGIRLAVNAVGGIGNAAIRIKVFDQLAAAGFVCPAVAHPTAFIEPSAMLSSGVQVFPRAYVGSDSRIGFGAILNTGSIVSHDCILADYANISPGAMLAGAVQVGRGTLIGMGVTINLEVKIGTGARIGNGATVKADVPENGIVRAGSVWPY